MLSKVNLRAYSSAAKPSSISSTLLLSRNPIITADIPKFEDQYFKYQNELWRRLMWTFPKWFYYRVGTLSEQRFRELNKRPLYNNPNIEYPTGRPEIRQERDRRFKQEVILPKTYEENKGSEDEEAAANTSMSRKITPNSRTTKADESGDYSSLERKLARTLYLVINDGKSWKFPNFSLQSTEAVKPLHLLAEEGLYQIGGKNINYFNVSNTPCHLINKDDSKEYLIKSHILSGQFVPQQSSKFMWLTKEELSEHLDATYFKEVEHLLNEI
ncbi:Piso0_005513 [Millerozyma farinosa CBS 7064]|uniref:Large ribosomal subunit protein mL46 n=1 Tax=Pichia sorbitophila (strain ATCC MYA-4447 / BCRC 22081 / CBS 7064 / NBRC 10061 / NRRL Y-12695) TaxID=559304 RepID=G8Y266_PICSO|nr:Piso0_005513 [Millerozyma farinosa CBS 7064]